jgi:uncharacterized protein with HEPN domain
MLPDRDLGHLGDIRLYAAEALEIVRETTADAFHEDRLRQHAVVRCLTVIGEASGRLSDAARELFPFDWNAMKGMRNILVHEYGRIDLDKVWSVVEELPPLVETLAAYLEAQP